MQNPEYTNDEIDILIETIQNDSAISETIKTRRVEMLEAMREPNGQSQAEIVDSVKQWAQDTQTGYHHINTTHQDKRHTIDTQAEADIKKWANVRK
jgi:hypothetical protein